MARSTLHSALAGLLLVIARGCTRGRLFLVDDASAQVAAYELDGSSRFTSTLAMLPHHGPGDARRLIRASSTDSFVAVVNLASNSVPDSGKVSFYDAGISPGIHHLDVAKTAPVLLDFQISCTYPIHYVAKDRKIAQFCDGSHDLGINTTVWVVDETKLRQGNALVYNMTLPGSHHGVAVALDGSKLLYSVPTPDRVAGGPNALPSGFEVKDYVTGEIVHGLNEMGDPHRSCVGFHGEAHHGDLVAFACNQDHGGILLLQTGHVVPPFTSRTINYPASLATHRTGGLHTHEKAPLAVGDFNARGVPDAVFHLAAFDPHNTSLTDMTMLHLQPMPARPCGHGYEKSGGQFLFAWMPAGNLQVWMPYPRWTLISDLLVLPGRSSCDGSALVVGHGSAFVMVEKALYEVDLTAYATGPLKVTSHGDLAVKPHTGVVAGVPPGFECPAPMLPSLPKGRTGASGFLVMRFTSQDAAIPGSPAQSSWLHEFRGQTAHALGVGLDRIYVQQLRKEPQASAGAMDFLLELMLADAGPNDVNRSSGAELKASLKAAISVGGALPSTWALAVGGLADEPFTTTTMATTTMAPTTLPATTLAAGTEGEGGWPTGAVGALIAAAVSALAAVLAAVAFFLKGQRLSSELAQLKAGSSA